MKFGLALKPKTEIDEKIRGLLSEGLVDMILIMTVGENTARNFIIGVTDIE